MPSPPAGAFAPPNENTGRSAGALPSTDAARNSLGKALTGFSTTSNEIPPTSTDFRSNPVNAASEPGSYGNGVLKYTFGVRVRMYLTLSNAKIESKDVSSGFSALISIVRGVIAPEGQGRPASREETPVPYPPSNRIFQNSLT